MQIEAFRERLAQVASAQIVNLVVVDEAHCVSEWGHDFRTSYLRLGRNLRRFTCGLDDVPPPILGLTGTASPAVLRDMERELFHSAGPVPAEVARIRPASYDRPNLHYVVVSSSEGSQRAVYKHLLRTTIPELLEIEPELLGEADGSATRSGITFVPHVNGKFGVVAFRHEGAEIFGPENVGVYCGEPPNSMALEAPEGVQDPNWNFDKHKAWAAQSFKDNRFPLLVSTKAFGMGIDKPNIRYTIHIGLPGSIESFAQEAGRAGRDGKGSYCTLIASSPMKIDARRLLDLRESRETRQAAYRELKRARVENDLMRQLFFHYNSFPDPALSADDAVECMRRLLDAGFSAGEHTVEVAVQPAEAGPLRFEKALHRLATLGIVDDYTIAYLGTTRIYSVHRGDLDPIAVQEALLEFAQRTDPGRFRWYRERCELAPNDLAARVEHFIEMAVEVVYGVIEPARISALEAMYEMATTAVSDEEIRLRISSYLGDGPLASILPSLIGDAESIDMSRVIAKLDSVPPVDPLEWVGATARQLEESPNHPVALLAGALAQAWLPTGDPELFVQRLGRSLERLPDYDVSGADALMMLERVFDCLDTRFDGRRSGWRPLVWVALDEWFPASEEIELFERALIGDPSISSAEKDAIRTRRQLRTARDAGEFTRTRLKGTVQ